MGGGVMLCFCGKWKVFPDQKRDIQISQKHALQGTQQFVNSVNLISMKIYGTWMSVVIWLVVDNIIFLNLMRYLWKFNLYETLRMLDCLILFKPRG